MTDPALPILNIRLFQRFEVTLAGQPVTKFEADTARALLAYLALRPGKAVTRETLARLLWTAEDGTNALTNLRSALRRVRSALEAADDTLPPDAFLLADRNTLTMDPAAPIWVDVLEFEQLLDQVRRHRHGSLEECATCREALRQATALYRGEFLADLGLDTVEFEEWRRAEAERLQRVTLHALYVLGEHAFRAGAMVEAEQTARRQLALESWNEEAHRQLMRILFASGRRTAALAQYDLCRRTLAAELGVDPDRETETLYLRLLAGESPTPRSVGPSPYKGLAPFGVEDAELFFGRDAAINRLHDAVTSHGAVVIIGPSGSGKSSLINAGLIPVLQGQAQRGVSQESQPGAAEWHISRVRLGQDPLAALAAALEERPTAGVRWLLVIDPFEEFFTLSEDTTLRAAFLERLLNDAVNLHPTTAVLMAMRSDFMSDALTWSTLADLIQQQAIVLGPVNRTELQRIIAEPARLRGVAFEPGLVERLLRDVGEGPGQLPLLQFALAELWERQDDGWVTHAAFDAIGGVRGALAKYADQIYDELSPAEQAQARRVFLTLVQSTGDAQDVRRLATRAEISDPAWPLVQRLANARLLITNRNAKGEETAELVHEALIREWGVLQGWLAEDREFQTWKQRTRVRMELWASAQQDETTVLQGARLLEARRWLTERAGEINGPLNTFIAASISTAERQQRSEEAARQRELASAQALAAAEHRRAEAEASGRRRLVWLIAGLVLVVIIAILTAIFAFNAQQQTETERQRAEQSAQAALTAQQQAETERQRAEQSAQTALTAQQQAETQRQRAEQSAQIALARQLSAQAINAQEAQVDQGLLLNQESRRRNTNADDNAELLLQTVVDPRLRKIQYGGEGAIFGLQWQADGASVLAHNEFGSVVRWDKDASQANNVLPSTAAEQQGVVFSPLHDKLMTWHEDVLTVRDAETLAVLYEITVPGTDNIYAIALSTDGSRILSYSGDSYFRLWDAASGALLEKYKVDLGRRDLLAVTSPDGHTVVLADEQDNIPLIQLWDITTDTAKLVLPQNHQDGVHQATVSPDARTLATASVDGSVRLWDLTTGQQIGEPLLGHTARVLFATFSPDGKTLASGGTDDQVILWDVASGQPIGAPLRGHANWVRNGVFSQDGTKLITGDSDGRILTWDVGMVQALRGHSDRVRAIALSPDEQTLVTAGFDKQLLVRDAETLSVTRQVATDHQNAIISAAYSPDGKTFATADAGGLLVLWDTTTWTPRQSLRSDEDSVLVGLAFSPDSQRVATGNFNGRIEVHDVATGRPVVEPFQAHTGWAMSLLFSPDGKRFYSGSSDQEIRLWDAQTFTALGEPLQGHTNWVTDLTLTPDGKTLVSASADETIRTWDAATGAPLGEPMQGHDRQVWNVFFRTIGERLVLVSLGIDGNVIWWDWATRTPLFPPLRTSLETELMRLSADGQRIFLGSMNPTAYVIDADLTPWSLRACQIANRNLTAAEWEEYLPDLPYQQTCPDIEE